MDLHHLLLAGLPGALRYIPVLIGLKRERFSFGRQDFFLTLVVFSTQIPKIQRNHSNSPIMDHI